ncbi:hypothetical protein GOODEAATRI_021921 [Goodea atripinnis]|uniref:Uncharacterized protein n=1 Tax=Goodea atripinnis TaxID=208336 RepID=A0ABV0Q0M2_9TELE
MLTRLHTHCTCEQCGNNTGGRSDLMCLLSPNPVHLRYPIVQDAPGPSTSSPKTVHIRLLNLPQWQTIHVTVPCTCSILVFTCQSGLIRDAIICFNGFICGVAWDIR